MRGRIASAVAMVAIWVGALVPRAHASEPVPAEEIWLRKHRHGTMLGLVIARRWTPDGPARVVLSGALERQHIELCNSTVVTPVFDRIYPAVALWEPWSLDCELMSAHDYRAHPTCLENAGASMPETEQEALYLLVARRLRAADGAPRAELTTQIVDLVRTRCGMAQFEWWCIDELWDARTLLTRKRLGCERADAMARWR